MLKFFDKASSILEKFITKKYLAKLRDYKDGSMEKYVCHFNYQIWHLILLQ